MLTPEKTRLDLHLFGPPDSRGIEEKEHQAAMERLFKGRLTGAPVVDDGAGCSGC